MKILLNKIKCLHCNEEIVSAHRHDFKFCKCKTVAVDGGESYLRRIGQKEDYEEASAYAIEFSKEIPGHFAGMFLVYSPNGKTPPSTVFHRKVDAQATARAMRERFNGDWYIATLESL